MPLEQLIASRRDEIRDIAARHGVTSVRVFGSVARGESRPGSDLDLLIEAGPNTTPWFPGGLVYDLETMLGCRVDVVTEEGLRPQLRESVLQDARPLRGTPRILPTSDSSRRVATDETTDQHR